MKRRSWLTILFFILLGIGIGPKPAAAGWMLNVDVLSGGAFVQTDMQGTWHMYDGSGYGTVDVDGSGAVTGGQVTSVTGGSVNVVSGNLTLAADGVLTGTIQLANGGIIYVQQGKVDFNKRTAYLACTTNISSQGILYLFKAGNTFAMADLDGQWKFYGFNSYGVGVFGLIGIDAFGSSNGLGFSYTSGGGAYIMIGNFTLSPSGKFGGNFTDRDSIGYSVIDAKMNSGKDIIIGNIKASNGAYVFGILLKQGSGFATADLQGAWHCYAVASTGAINQGGVNITNAGLISGTMTNLASAAVTNVSGELWLSTMGSVVGTTALSDFAPDNQNMQDVTSSADVMANPIGILSRAVSPESSQADAGNMPAIVSFDAGSVYSGQIDTAGSVLVTMVETPSGVTSGGGGGGGGCFVETLR